MMHTNSISNMAWMHLVATLLLAAAISGDERAERKIKEFSDCAKKFSVSQQGFEDFFNMETVDGVKDHKCFAKCVLERYNIVTDKFDLTKMKAAVSTDWQKPEDQKKILPVLDDCHKQVKMEADLCDFSYQYMGCFMNGIKQVKTGTNYIRWSGGKYN